MYYPYSNQVARKAAIKDGDIVLFATATTAKASARKDGALACGVAKGTVLAHDAGGLLIISNGTPKWYHEDDITLYKLSTPIHPDADTKSTPTLNKQTLNMRIPTNEEWDRLMDVTHEDNAITHWKDVLSWIHNKASENTLCRVARGYFSVRYWHSCYAEVRSVHVGFRPTFEGTNTDTLPLDKNKTVIIGTLYMDGSPVRVPKNPVWNGDIADYVSGATLNFGPALDDPAYQVRAIKVGDVHIADRVLLKNISYEDLEKALFSKDTCPEQEYNERARHLMAITRNGQAIELTRQELFEAHETYERIIADELMRERIAAEISAEAVTDEIVEAAVEEYLNDRKAGYDDVLCIRSAIMTARILWNRIYNI